MRPGQRANDVDCNESVMVDAMLLSRTFSLRFWPPCSLLSLTNGPQGKRHRELHGQDFVFTGSDGSSGHPRKYGTFSREHPDLLADGMRWVFVNGVAAVDAGRLTGKLAGRAIRRRTS